MENAMEISHLSKKYGGHAAVENFSAVVKKGECFGLLGANGAGKSTTIECILGTKKADTGTATILGMNPQKNRKALFERVSVQFQESCYQDKITVKELCEETAVLYEDVIEYAVLLKRFGLTDKQKKLVSELSGGEKQRLFVLLALIPKPEVIFMDEFTTGLDARARLDIWKQLLDLKKSGVSIFLTSHFMDEVEALCDKICILKKGKIIFEGTTIEAIAKSECNTFEDAYLWFTDEEADEHEEI